MSKTTTTSELVTYLGPTDDENTATVLYVGDDRFDVGRPVRVTRAALLKQLKAGLDGYEFAFGAQGYDEQSRDKLLALARERGLDVASNVGKARLVTVLKAHDSEHARKSDDPAPTAADAADGDPATDSGSVPVE